MTIRLKDIAASCRLDVSTVSRALRGDIRLRPETVERVRSEAGRLGYRANPAAQALVGAKTHVIWLILSSMSNVLEQEIAESASRFFEDEGYDLAVVLCHGSAERYGYLLERLRSHHVDGALVVPPFGREARKVELAYEEASEASSPLVFVDRYPESSRLPVVTTGNRSAAAELVDRLVREGAGQIIILDNPEANEVQKERCAGYMEKSRILDVPFCITASRDMDFPEIPADRKIGIVASSWHPAVNFAAKYRSGNPTARLLAGVFDCWEGDRNGFDAIFVCRQNFKGMARKAVDILLSEIEGRPQSQARIEVPVLNCEKLA